MYKQDCAGPHVTRVIQVDCWEEGLQNSHPDFLNTVPNVQTTALNLLRTCLLMCEQ